MKYKLNIQNFAAELSRFEVLVDNKLYLIEGPINAT